MYDLNVTAFNTAVATDEEIIAAQKQIKLLYDKRLYRF